MAGLGSIGLNKHAYIPPQIAFALATLCEGTENKQHYQADPRTRYEAFVHEILRKIRLQKQISVRDDVRKKLSNQRDMYEIFVKSELHIRKHFSFV